MTDVKSSLITLIDFFRSFNQEIREVNLKLTFKGQISYATGILHPGKVNAVAVEKAYRKKLVSKDYRFCNTVLDFGVGNKFIITSK